LPGFVINLTGAIGARFLWCARHGAQRRDRGEAQGCAAQGRASSPGGLDTCHGLLQSPYRGKGVQKSVKAIVVSLTPA